MASSAKHDEAAQDGAEDKNAKADDAEPHWATRPITSGGSVVRGIVWPCAEPSLHGLATPIVAVRVQHAE